MSVRPRLGPSALAAALLLACAHPALAQSVSLSGVAGDKALLVIDQAAPRFLSAGQTHQGVRLLSVQGETVTIEMGGQRQQLRVGDAPLHVGGGDAAGSGSAGRRVVLTADGQGHFMTHGQINGRTVKFMVDTGASNIILSQADARRINLAFDQGQPVGVNTANGRVTGHQLRLQSVRVGDVQVYDVTAIVLPQPMPFVLLGNSFLTRFQMVRQNDQMTLERRY
jgi:aspartyl protease family protein